MIAELKYLSSTICFEHLLISKMPDNNPMEELMKKILLVPLLLTLFSCSHYKTPQMAEVQTNPNFAPQEQMNADEAERHIASDIELEGNEAGNRPLASAEATDFYDLRESLYNLSRTTFTQQWNVLVFNARNHCNITGKTAATGAAPSREVLDNIQFLKDRLKSKCGQNCKISFSFNTSGDYWCKIKATATASKRNKFQEKAYKLFREMPITTYFSSQRVQRVGLGECNMKANDSAPGNSYIDTRVIDAIEQVKIDVLEQCGGGRKCKATIGFDIIPYDNIYFPERVICEVRAVATPR